MIGGPTVTNSVVTGCQTAPEVGLGSRLILPGSTATYYGDVRGG